jgi:Pentapeptide repeats (8 copies)
VRIGGIYALERVARDSARDHPTVMEVLTAFIREHSREPWPPPDPSGQEQERWTPPDIQAAVTVIGRRYAKRDIERLNLYPAYLVHAYLRDADFTGARLRDAKLTGAYARGATLTSADLRDADLTDAQLDGAKLTGADLDGAILTEAGADSGSTQAS